jgi:hypothetical protein
MKSFSKLLLSFTFILMIGISAKAQYPAFIVDWNPCEVQVTGSEYHVKYAIYNTTTSTFVVPETDHPTTFLHTAPFGEIYSTVAWSCNQQDTKPYLYIFVEVQLKKGDDTYCVGSGRSSLLTCEEIYNLTTTITVNMIQ